MCKWGTDKVVEVTMQPICDSAYQPNSYCNNHPNDPKCQGEWKKKCKIDKCIASIVQVLEDNNIRMLASCCGHGKESYGSILLLNRSELIIPIEFTNNRMKRGNE